MTKRTLAHLDRRHISYEYVDIDDNPEAASWVAAQNGGKEKKPTLDIRGKILAEPSNQELDKVLSRTGVCFIAD